MGRQVDWEQDQVTVDGQPVPEVESKVTIAYHKPMGVISTCRTSRESGPAITDKIDLPFRVYPAGRLDRDSSGLMVLTNDGDLALTITHPRYGKEKEYRVSLIKPLSKTILQRLQSGVELDDGMIVPVRVWETADGSVGVVITEGRKRLVRRMFEAVGNRVTALHRVRIGDILLVDLAPGEWRMLSDDEIRSLRKGTNP
jgi:pseudouridine synthase